MTEKYLEELGLLSSIDDNGRKYISECLDNAERKFCEITTISEELLDRADRDERLLVKIKDEYCRYAEMLIKSVRKYYDTLESDSIWSSVCAVEAAKKLRTYYAFTKRIEELEMGKMSCFSDLLDVEKTLECINSVERKIRLFEISLLILMQKSEGLNSVKEQILFCKGKSEKMASRYFEIMKTAGENENALGQFLFDLKNALDEQNKGERMNIANARNCCLSFLAKYRLV